jgi:hypothetical protein
MLAEEILHTNARAAEQAIDRNARYEARSNLQATSHPSSASSDFSAPDPCRSMEAAQYARIIETIPVFSGTSTENVSDWLEIITLKFDIIGYDATQKRRFVPQYLDGNAMKWHLAHREDLTTWDAYTRAIRAAFPRLQTASRDMNLQMLKNRLQTATESFTEYDNAILILCRQHDPDMDDRQVVDWLKAGMAITLYERLQGEEFTTPQDLLVRAQRLELDRAVLVARQRELIPPASAPHVPTSSSGIPYASEPMYYSPPPPSSYPSSYATPLMSIPPAVPSTPSYPSGPPVSPPYQQSRARRPIVCYSCGQPGHISPRCPYRPKV